MRILQLGSDPAIYSSNVFLVLGDWSKLDDVNTLIDPGANPAVLDFVAASPTGLGKRSLDQVILTHCHSDHSKMVSEVVRRFEAPVRGWEAAAAYDVVTLVDGQVLTVGDRTFEVLHTPGHSSDSICLYCERERVLFSGDTPLVINSSDGTYEQGYVEALERLSARRIDTIYFGHGPALTAGCDARVALTLRHVRESTRRDLQIPAPVSRTIPSSADQQRVTP